MHQNKLELGCAEIQRVFPYVAILPLGIAVELGVVGIDAESTRVETEDALEKIGNTGIRSDIARKVHRIAENILGISATARIDADQRVAEARSRVVHETFGVDQRESNSLHPISPTEIVLTLG